MTDRRNAQPNDAEPDLSQLDPDLLLLADYLSQGLSPAERAGVDARLRHDAEFYEKVWRLMVAFGHSVPPRPTLALVREPVGEDAPDWDVTEADVEEVFARFCATIGRTTDGEPIARAAARSNDASVLALVKPQAPRAPRPARRSVRAFLPLPASLFPLTPWRVARFAAAVVLLVISAAITVTKIILPLTRLVQANAQLAAHMKKARVPEDIDVPPVPTVALPATPKRFDQREIAPPVPKTVKPDSVKAVTPDSVKAIKRDSSATVALDPAALARAAARTSDSLAFTKRFNRTAATTVTAAATDSEYEEVALGAGMTAYVRAGSRLTIQSQGTRREYVLTVTLDGEAAFDISRAARQMVAVFTTAGSVMLNYGGRYAVRSAPDSSEMLITDETGRVIANHLDVKPGQFARVPRGGRAVLADGVGFPKVPLPKDPPPERPEDRP